MALPLRARMFLAMSAGIFFVAMTLLVLFLLLQAAQRGSANAIFDLTGFFRGARINVALLIHLAVLGWIAVMLTRIYYVLTRVAARLDRSRLDVALTLKKDF